MKDAARLLAYFAATSLCGALAARGVFPALAEFEFESFFHRALILGALAFLWPFLSWLRVTGRRDLGLERNEHWLRHLIIGFLLAAGPVICCEVFLVQRGVYSMRPSLPWTELLAVLPSAIVVPLIEEPLFRGLFLGVLLRGFRPWPANLISAAIFSIVHFLKAPDLTTTTVHWYSGFISLAHSFDQFREPVLVLAGFTTLFVIGLILAHARVRTRSLWAPIGLHTGWVLASMAFAKLARRAIIALPWLGKNLLVGLVPLAICLLSWVLLRTWLKYAGPRAS